MLCYNAGCVCGVNVCVITVPLGSPGVVCLVSSCFRVVMGFCNSEGVLTLWVGLRTVCVCVCLGKPCVVGLMRM